MTKTTFIAESETGIPPLLTHILFPAKTLLDAAETQACVKFSGTTWHACEITEPVSFRLHFPFPGEYRITFGLLDGAEFLPPALLWNGLENPVSLRSGTAETKYSAPSLRTFVCNVPNVPDGDFILKAEPRENARAALVFLSAELAEDFFLDTRSAFRETETPDLYRTFLHLPFARAGLFFRLSTQSRAELRFDGISYGHASSGKPLCFMTPDGLSPNILAHIVEVKASHGDFHLESSPLCGAGFYPEIPDFLRMTPTAARNYPTAELKRGDMRAEVTLFDAEHNFYQGARFERAGSVLCLTYGKHRIFTLNYDPARRSPHWHDHVGGQTEEFSDTLDCPGASGGPAFVKIGNGLFAKPVCSKPEFQVPYRPIRIFPWTWTLADTRIALRQEMELTDGFAYVYEKLVELPEDGHSLEISYRLTNTGSKHIATKQYAHNFIGFDGHRINTDYSIKCGFSPAVPANHPAFSTTDRVVTPHGGQRAAFVHLASGEISADCNTTVIQHRSGFALRVWNSYPTTEFNLYVSETAICPESYVLLNIAPGETSEWKRSWTVEEI